MDVFWENIMVLVAVCLAITYLALRSVRRKRRRSGCANCPTLKVLQDQRQAKTK